MARHLLAVLAMEPEHRERSVMNITTTSKRPDQLTKGDHVFHPASKRWEPVADAYWSEAQQRYIVWLGPLGMSMHLYSKGVQVNAQRYH